MTPRALRISTQLRLALSVIVLLVAALGGLSWRQAGAIWADTQNLYDHPFRVRVAAAELQRDVLGIHRALKDVVLASDELARTRAHSEMDAFESEALRQLDAMEASYIGPNEDLVELRRALAGWRAIRDETVRLLRAGERERAAARTMPGGEGRAHVDHLEALLDRIGATVKENAQRFFLDVSAHKDTLALQLAAALLLALALASALGVILVRSITRPLEGLTAVAERFGAGDLGARSAYASTNELGTLSAAFNTLGANMQSRVQLADRAAAVSAVMLRETELRPFCREVLAALVKETGAQLGAFYLLNARRTEYDVVESIGVGEGGRRSFAADLKEGEIGVALATRKLARTRDIEGGTRFLLATAAGEALPREIVTLPLTDGTDVAAVISFASLRPFDAAAIELIEALDDTLTARLLGVLVHRKLADFAQRLEEQNRELEAQKQELELQGKELGAQTSELTEMNAELELQKRQLGEASRLKSAFLANMSHELRTPLNSVIALSGVLSRRLSTSVPEEERGYLEIIERNGRQLLALINDILDLSRIEAGREDLALAYFSLAQLASEVTAMLTPLARDKGLTLACIVDAELPSMRSDPAKVRHILQNLVDNAVKFTDQGSVRVSAGHQNGRLWVAVQDTGIGIAAEQLPYIFEEFRQADGSASRKHGGTGLGLAIARRYAKLLGGGIEVTSTLGQGTTFTLTLPLALSAGEGDTARVTPPRAPPTTPAAAAGQLILLVEDNDPAAVQITDVLEAGGYRVRRAKGGDEALAMVEVEKPAAVILDLMMPGKDGFEVLRAMRALEGCAEVPVLILTAKHVTRDELRTLEGNHIHQLIEKGDVNRAELLAEVARMVSGGSTPPTARAAHAARARTGPPLLLLVEDNPDNLKTLRALLAGRCTLIEAHDGKAGLVLAREQRPDLILLDLALPVMDGFSVLAALRKDDEVRDIPVVAVTASAMRGDREAILARGFDGYIAKPIDVAELHATITRLIDGT